MPCSRYKSQMRSITSLARLFRRKHDAAGRSPIRQEMVTPAVDRQNLARDHARFVTGEMKRHVSDIVRLDQAEQMRVGKLRQRGVSGDELFDPIAHRRRWRNRIGIKGSAAVIAAVRPAR